MLATAALAGLEQLVNAGLALDPDVNMALAQMHGRTIGLELRGFELRIYFVPTADRLLVQGQLEGEPDVLLIGSPLALASIGMGGDKVGELFSGRVDIRGDLGLAQRFGRVLGQIDIDWEEEFSHLVGDVLAHESVQGLRKVGCWLHESQQGLEQSLSEYLQEESRLLPRTEEVAAFNAGVDDLRDGVERLLARIRLLEQGRGHL
jgi:ubiquinone biosynthesis protein UbiJ